LQVTNVESIALEAKGTLTFSARLKAATGDGPGLCVGLDPLLERLPEKLRQSSEPLLSFNLEIIEATSEYASAYKPNLAFYELFGAAGWRQLEETIRAVPEGKVVIADGKRGDIGSTAKAYAAALFDGLGSDAATVNPYLGSDALDPFLQRQDKGAFILALTSNPGGSDLQQLISEGEPIYSHVIRLARGLNRLGNVGLVVGATRPEIWPEILPQAEDLPLLIPGVGAQGGGVAALKEALKSYPAPALVNASRSIIYASSGDDFKRAARDAARRLLDQLRS